MRDAIEIEPNTGFILKTSRLNIVLSTLQVEDQGEDRNEIMKFEARTNDMGEYVGHAMLEISKECFGKVGELTYELEPNFRGQCFATEMLRSVIAYTYAERELVSLYGLAPNKNLAAQYVLQRIGFALNEELDGFIRYVAWNPIFQTTQEA
ncbi:MAG: GNAT family N-acetyltransferase [Alphaproteobacteria bacterium]|nr:GNAT family N-acetyltransferase [Alphaproteobacteria bacterium]